MMSPDKLLAVLLRRRWILLLTTALTMVGVAALTFSLPKVYTSTAYMLVTPSKAVGSDFEATQLTQILTKTYSELLQADSVSREVDRTLGIENADEAIAVTAVPQSQLLAIQAEGRAPEVAQRIANTYADVFQRRVEVLSAGRNTAGSVSVAEPASLPTSPSRPRPLLYLALGALLAAVTGVAVAFARERFDQRLLLDASSTEIFGVPIIGRFPRGAHRSSGPAALAESARLVLANLAFANLGERPRTVAVISPSEQEGKSTCSLAIAQAAAELEGDVLLVEADLRRPSLTDKIGGYDRGWRPPWGLSTALVRPDLPIVDQLLEVPQSSLDLLPAGPLPPNPAALLGSERLIDFDRRAREEFGFVVYDTPPIAAGADATYVADCVDGVVLVVDAGKTRRSRVVQAVEQLRRARANVLGIVVNRSLDAVEGYYYASDKGADLAGSDPYEPPAEERSAGRGGRLLAARIRRQ